MDNNRVLLFPLMIATQTVASTHNSRLTCAGQRAAKQKTLVFSQFTM